MLIYFNISNNIYIYISPTYIYIYIYIYIPYTYVYIYIIIYTHTILSQHRPSAGPRDLPRTALSSGERRPAAAALALGQRGKTEGETAGETGTGCGAGACEFTMLMVKNS